MFDPHSAGALIIFEQHVYPHTSVKHSSFVLQRELQYPRHSPAFACFTNHYHSSRLSYVDRQIDILISQKVTCKVHLFTCNLLPSFTSSSCTCINLSSSFARHMHLPCRINVGRGLHLYTRNYSINLCLTCSHLHSLILLKLLIQPVCKSFLLNRCRSTSINSQLIWQLLPLLPLHALTYSPLGSPWLWFIPLESANATRLFPGQIGIGCASIQSVTCCTVLCLFNISTHASLSVF